MEQKIEKDDKPLLTFEEQNNTQDLSNSNNENTDCLDCSSIICSCNKSSKKLKNCKREDKKTEKTKKDVDTNLTEHSPVKTSDLSKRLLGKSKAKQRLQAFSSKRELLSIPLSSKSKKSLNRPKLVVSIETQYDENGEITEDSLVIRKPPKPGPCPQEKAKAVICEIEEIKRRETKMQQSLENSKTSSKLSSAIHMPHPRPPSKLQYGRSDRYDEHRSKSNSRHRSREITSWSDVKSAMLMNNQYRRKVEPITRSMTMRSILHCFEEENLISGTYFCASAPDKKFGKLYYKESVKYTSALPQISYCESPRTVNNLYPTRSEILDTVPKKRAELMKTFFKNCSSGANNSISSKSKSQLWYPAFNYLIDTERKTSVIKPNNLTIKPKDSKESKEPKKEESKSVDNIPVKSYGLAVLSESYRNHWDDSENEIDENELISIDVLQEGKSSSNSHISQNTPKHKSKKSSKTKYEKTKSKKKKDSKDNKKKDDSRATTNIKDNTKHKTKKKVHEDEQVNEKEKKKKDEKETSAKETKKSKNNDNNNKKSESQGPKKEETRKKSEERTLNEERIRTPDTDEYKSNWEVDDDFFLDNKSPIYENEVWDSDDNSGFSQKVSKKFQKNRYPDKFNYADITYDKKDTSCGLSDSFINSFGYRKSSSKSDIEHKSSKSTEKYSSKNKTESYKYKKDKEKHVESKFSKSKDDSSRDKKRKDLSKISLNFIEEELERKRKSMLKKDDRYSKHYDNIDRKIMEKEYERAIETLYLETEKHKTYWDYDEENYDSFVSNRRERMWEEKHFWKEDDVNEFRMKEKIQLEQTLEIQNELQLSRTSSEFNESINVPKSKSDENLNEKLENEQQFNTQLSDISNSSEIIEKPKEQILNPPDTVESTSKLVSEYEEFMKTVGFDVSEEVVANKEELQLKTLEKNDTKTSKDSEVTTKGHASSSSEDESGDEYSKNKSHETSKSKKRKKSTSSSSSDSSSSSSSSSSDSSSSDSSSDSSSESSDNTKNDIEEMIDPKNIKVEKLSDDENKQVKTDQILDNNIKKEKIDAYISEKPKIDQEELSSTNLSTEIAQNIVASSDFSNTDIIPKDTIFSNTTNYDEFSIGAENNDVKTNDDLKQDNSQRNIENSQNITSTISLTLTPTKKFKPLVLPKDSKTSNDLTDVPKNHQPKNSVEKSEEMEIDVDFTDIIMKRSREHDHSPSPEHKKVCREKKISRSPERDKYHSESRRKSPEKPKSRDRRDDYRYRRSPDKSKDYYRDRKRSDHREYRHSRRHYDSDSDRESKYYHSDRYRSSYRIEKEHRGQEKDERRSEIRRSRSPIERKPTETHPKQEIECASNSPLGGLKKSVADSTISDSELIAQSFQNHETESSKKAERVSRRQISPPSADSPLSPKRLSLDDRINQFLGIETDSSRSKTEEQIYAQNSYDDYMSQEYYERYGNYMSSQYEQYSVHNSTVPPENFYSGVTPSRYPPSQASGTQVLQVGNVLQVVPTELPYANDGRAVEGYPAVQSRKVEEDVKTKVVQVGNMLQIVPTEVLPEIIATNTVPPKTVKASKTVADTKEVMVVQIPVVVKQEEKKTVIDEVQRQRKLEKEKRHAEREQRRKERELKRIEKQKRKEQRLKIKTEKMIKRALLLETSENFTPDLDISDIIDNDKTEETNTSNVLQTMWPPPAPLPTNLDPPSKGILVKSGFSKLKHESDSPLVTDILSEEKIRIQKTVKFADGICPGEGTSPSAGEDLPSPPPPKRKLPKEQRYKKTQLRTKKKVKVKIIRPAPVVSADDNDDDSDDNLPPPPPPPGSPPPHLWPPKYSVETVPQFVGPPSHPPFPVNHPPFPNGGHLPPPGFVPPNVIISPQKPSGPPPPPPPPVINFSSQPPPIFPPTLGSDRPPPPPPPPLPHSQFHDARQKTMPVYMTNFAKMV